MEEERERVAADPHAQVVSAVGAATLAALEGLELAQRRLHPPAIPALRGAIEPLRQHLECALARLRELTPPPALAEFHERLALGAQDASRACQLFCQEAPRASAVSRILASMSAHCQAQETLYPLRTALPPLGGYFVEPPLRGRAAELDGRPRAGASVGIHRAGAGDDPDARGGFHLYVPECYDGSSPSPLVVALHGGSGRGREFLWTWLREARSRRFLLLAPTARGATWSFQGPDVDAPALRSMVAYVAERWRVDRERILVTGLSDGATYALLCGLAPESPFTAVAVVSGVLHPTNFANGNLGRAAGRRVYVVHGALDWMFPVALARMARDVLERSGADLTYREIADLSHTYPREENARILDWFDPSLALGSGNLG